MYTNVIPIILSGGSGTRLWPLSRKNYPKQLLKLLNDYSLLQNTLLRVDYLSSPIVVCNQEHRFLVAEQLLEIGIEDAKILLEPEPKNTAPAIALAALEAIRQHQDATVVVLPADHVIEDKAAFQDSLAVAVDEAQQHKLMTFGITPTQPETGYGYIKATHKNDGTSLSIDKFVEKPDLKTAKNYVASGEYFWNSGIFVFQAKTFLQELEVFEPTMSKVCRQAFEQATIDLDFVRIHPQTFAQCPSQSIDYAIMEKTTRGAVIPFDSHWSDLGSWASLWQASAKDANNNAKIGDVIDIDCKNSLIYAEDHLIAAVGIDSLIVVDTKDALLIAAKDRAQDVKRIVEQLEASEREEHLLHREVHRPWGSYDSVDNGQRHQVKRIKVKPGKSLSLQMHHHRAEHWVVVSGTALVQLADDEQVLSEDQSIYIPLGTVHRLTNPGKVDLHIIEVQTGAYLGEDDIVRLEDNFGRS